MPARGGFFPAVNCRRKKWKDALTEIGAEFQQFAGQYKALGWHEAIGSSGTHKAIGEMCAAMKLTKGAITAQALPALRDELLKAKRIEDIQLAGLAAERRPIIAGGILVLEAAFQALGLEKLMVSKAAMREGILYDMLGRGGENDPRDSSVASLVQRYGIDEVQAARVEATACRLFDQVCESWQLDGDDAQVLRRAARLHELGLIIAHSQYHVHGSYILEHSDIAGFFTAGTAGTGRAGAHASAQCAQDRLRRPCPTACCCRPGARPRCCGWRCCCTARMIRTRFRPWNSPPTTPSCR